MLEVLHILAIVLLVGGIALKVACHVLKARVAGLEYSLCSEYLIDDEEEYEDEEYDIRGCYRNS